MKVAGHYVFRISPIIRRYSYLLKFLFFALLLVEEYKVGYLRVAWKKRYSHTVYIPITVRRISDAPRIAIVSIVYDDKKLHEYRFAETTVKCYAELHKYPLIKLNFKNEPRLLEKCPGKDFMFQRHCVISNLMAEKENSFDYFLFIDSDMGVVSPNHLIEDYIDLSADMIFYDRLFNYEIAAGSYLVKNTQFSRDFLQKWSLYEHEMIPGSFQATATDNGAIQAVYMDEFCSNCTKAALQRCKNLWEQSKWWDDLFLFESCARVLLGPRSKFQNENGTVVQLSNALGYWVRDAGITDSRWSVDDFFLHNWKESNRNNFEWFGWFSPFVNENFNMSLCKRPEKAHLNWPYKNTFLKTKGEMRHELQKIFDDSYAEHLRRWSIVEEKYPL